uniref:pesticin C-terminus-like muramidase n=1 Tax=Ningiella ruwaisensis TaxID=2364274 RepID=UPI00109F58EF|nr:pesticin C-terminus-like muramidase [Ningiella ruwaisensis]
MTQTQSDQSSSRLPKIDFDFISQLEGGCLTTGYVPDPEHSKSGVTISVGFDLGARNASDLRALPLNPDLIDKLTPYLGLQGMEAKAFLDEHPLEITQAQANVINQSIKRQFIEQLQARYNQASDLPFENIPPAWQTVITSVEFQYGNASKRCPSFWRCVTTQDWHAAIKELRNFGDRYSSRRNKEADYASKHA